jgi:hypothetical protein
MTLFLFKLLLFCVSFSTSLGESSEIDLGASCIVRYLKNKGKIPSEFPNMFVADSTTCEDFSK